MPTSNSFCHGFKVVRNGFRPQYVSIRTSKPSTWHFFWPERVKGFDFHHVPCRGLEANLLGKNPKSGAFLDSRTSRSWHFFGLVDVAVLFVVVVGAYLLLFWIVQYSLVFFFLVVVFLLMCCFLFYDFVCCCLLFPLFLGRRPETTSGEAETSGCSHHCGLWNSIRIDGDLVSVAVKRLGHALLGLRYPYRVVGWEGSGPY